ncbi:UNVERIFIED_CONTAM: hypothetical protein K2H54_036490 [Gekko kuhli]
MPKKLHTSSAKHTYTICPLTQSYVIVFFVKTPKEHEPTPPYNYVTPPPPIHVPTGGFFSPPRRLLQASKDHHHHFPCVSATQNHNHREQFSRYRLGCRLRCSYNTSLPLHLL